MYKDLLISKEKMEQMCRGELKRQLHHITHKGDDTYKESVTDNVETFFQSLQHEKNPTSYSWTYFVPALTQEELKLVDKRE